MALPMRLEFASDNVSGMAPEALDALVKANAGFAQSYGLDPWTERAGDLLRQMLDADVEVHFVSTGTAANAIAVAALCRPFEAVALHEEAHLFTHETGAAGFFGQGMGMIPLGGPSGRIAIGALRERLGRTEFPTRQAPAALSLSIPTEYGTIYGADELDALCGLARERELAVHIDGARLANAIAAGFDPRRLKSLGVATAVIGGAKAGLPATEAVVLFDRRLAPRFRTRLKQAGQLASKSRYLSAPWVGMLESGAFVRRAAETNALARRLAQALPWELAHPVETNAVFVRMDPAEHAALTAAGWEAFDFDDGSYRFLCSWATTDRHVEELLQAVHAIRS